MPRRNLTSSELTQLISRKSALVTLKPAEFKILVHPYYYPNELKKGIQKALDNKKHTYNNRLGGIILGYNRVVVDITKGRLNGAYPEYPVSCDCYVFEPSVGSTLTGIVNKVGKDYIGCMVHKYLYASILRPEDEDYQVWVNRQIFCDEEISFTVKELDYTRPVPTIEGVFLQPSTNETLSTENSHDNSQKRKKRSKKDKTIEQLSSTQVKMSTPVKNDSEFDFLSPIPHTPSDSTIIPKSILKKKNYESDSSFGNVTFNSILPSAGPSSKKKTIDTSRVTEDKNRGIGNQRFSGYTQDGRDTDLEMATIERVVSGEDNRGIVNNYNSGGNQIDGIENDSSDLKKETVKSKRKNKKNPDQTQDDSASAKTDVLQRDHYMDAIEKVAAMGPEEENRGIVSDSSTGENQIDRVEKSCNTAKETVKSKKKNKLVIDTQEGATAKTDLMQINHYLDAIESVVSMQSEENHTTVDPSVSGKGKRNKGTDNKRTVRDIPAAGLTLMPAGGGSPSARKRKNSEQSAAGTAKISRSSQLNTEMEKGEENNMRNNQINLDPATKQSKNSKSKKEKKSNGNSDTVGDTNAGNNLSDVGELIKNTLGKEQQEEFLQRMISLINEMASRPTSSTSSQSIGESSKKGKSVKNVKSVSKQQDPVGASSVGRVGGISKPGSTPSKKRTKSPEKFLGMHALDTEMDVPELNSVMETIDSVAVGGSDSSDGRDVDPSFSEMGPKSKQIAVRERYNIPDYDSINSPVMLKKIKPKKRKEQPTGKTEQVNEKLDSIANLDDLKSTKKKRKKVDSTMNVASVKEKKVGQEGTSKQLSNNCTSKLEGESDDDFVTRMVSQKLALFKDKSPPKKLKNGPKVVTNKD